MIKNQMTGIFVHVTNLREVCAVKPLHVEYELTEQGQSFLPILLMINDWGWNHLFKAD